MPDVDQYAQGWEQGYLQAMYDLRELRIGDPRCAVAVTAAADTLHYRLNLRLALGEQGR